MRSFFLGKLSHWVLLALLAALLYGVGTTKLHVTHFNSFALSLLCIAVGLVAALRMTTAPDDRVTRESLGEEVRDRRAGDA